MPGFIVAGRGVEPGTGLRVRNYTEPEVPRFSARGRGGSPVTELIVHETVTCSAKDTIAALERRGLGVHLVLAPDGELTQHGDLATDKLAHASQHNRASIGVEIVNPYYPCLLRPGLPWAQSLEAPWAHDGKYVVPTLAQLEVVTSLISWAATPGAGLAISRAWVGLRGTTMAMGAFDSAVALRPGIYAHHYFGHADGCFPVLYAWLRLEAQLSPDAALAEAVRRATGARTGVDLSDLIRPVALEA